MDVHSVEVTQVPVRLEEVVHASLGNWTTENRPMGMGLGAEELRPMATTSIMIAWAFIKIQDAVFKASPFRL